MTLSDEALWRILTKYPRIVSLLENKKYSEACDELILMTQTETEIDEVQLFDLCGCYEKLLDSDLEKRGT